MRKIVAILTGVSAFFAMAVAAGAQTATPVEQVGAQIESGTTSFTDAVVTYGIPALFGLLMLGLVIRLGVKLLKRGARAV